MSIVPYLVSSSFSNMKEGFLRIVLFLCQPPLKMKQLPFQVEPFQELESKPSFHPSG